MNDLVNINKIVDDVGIDGNYEIVQSFYSKWSNEGTAFIALNIVYMTYYARRASCIWNARTLHTAYGYTDVLNCIVSGGKYAMLKKICRIC